MVEHYLVKVGYEGSIPFFLAALFFMPLGEKRCSCARFFDLLRGPLKLNPPNEAGRWGF